MNDHTDELQGLVGELALLLLAEETLDSTLRRTAHLAVSMIPNCDMCGVSMAIEGRMGTRVSTGDVAQQMDDCQYIADEGPCVETIRSGLATRVPSINQETRWPDFLDAATRAGLVSSYSVPLMVRDETVGAMNFYSMTGAFEQSDEQAVLDLTNQAAVTLANASAYKQTTELVKNLGAALESREVIGQAVGMIMQREGCGSDEAFRILRSMSQKRNEKLRAVAQRVVGARRPEAQD